MGSSRHNNRVFITGEKMKNGQMNSCEGQCLFAEVIFPCCSHTHTDTLSLFSSRFAAHFPDRSRADSRGDVNGFCLQENLHRASQVSLTSGDLAHPPGNFLFLHKQMQTLLLFVSSALTDLYIYSFSRAAFNLHLLYHLRFFFSGGHISEKKTGILS